MSHGWRAIKDISNRSTLGPRIRRAIVRLITPIAAVWVARQERRILRSGVPLTPEQLADARAAGVQDVRKIRLLQVAAIPFAHQPLMRRMALSLRLIPPHIAGLTARYGIFIRVDRWNERALLVHEFAHTAQYERSGGIAAFLQRYLSEWLSKGYPLGELEIEAADTARRICC